MIDTGTMHPSAERGTTPTFAERVAARVGTALQPKRLSRRGFPWRTTVVGTALAVNPFDFILKPGTAYASVCGAGASCSSGWTAFCCTINGGANLCPPESYVAGWWRIDDSAFCRGSARYIIDCNRKPRSTCRCRCASGTCDERRVCCNNFRYGQCNQQVAGVTEVVCRVVTCTAPWTWDPSCTRTVRVDNRTATHSAPCLPGANPSHIDMKYLDLGLTGAQVGTPSGAERAGANEGRIRNHTNGYITYRSGVGAWSVHGRLARAYADRGLEGGRLGYISADPRSVGDGRGSRATFQRGWILWTEQTGAHAVRSPFLAVYTDQGGPRGRLGYPLADRRSSGDGRGRVQYFEDGAIHEVAEWGVRVVHGGFHRVHEELGGNRGVLGYPRGRRKTDATGRGHTQRFEGGHLFRSPTTRTRPVTGRIAKRYRALGTTASVLGFPTSYPKVLKDGRGSLQRFEGGAIVATKRTGAWELPTAWLEVYESHGGARGPMGYPVGAVSAVGDGTGQLQAFEGGHIYRTKATRRRAVYGPIDVRYRQEGGPTGWLGYPTSSVVALTSGHQRVRFEHGRITHDPTTGATVVEAS
jgi:uncharacterized protein with LGFP repeats